MRRPTMMCMAWTTRLPREPVGQLRLHLDEAGERDARIGTFGARGEFCVGTPLDEAFRALAGQFR